MGASCSCLNSGQVSTRKNDTTLEVTLNLSLGSTMLIARSSPDEPHDGIGSPTANFVTTRREEQ